MKIFLKPGKYVVAVSGGVDSMVLLHLLKKMPDVELIVAHFDHGVRPDSAKDRQLVQAKAADYNLPFTFAEAKLDPKTSEAKARTARYRFLEKVRSVNKAYAIITAHHQDDLLETAVINMLRGTGRRGLSSLSSRDKLVRPLLKFTKKQIYQYAKKHKLQWREDSTNRDEKFLRNYVRHQILPKISYAKRQQLLSQIKKLGQLNLQIDQLLKSLHEDGPSASSAIARKWFINLPNNVATEVMAEWLRQNQLSLDSKTLSRLTVATKTLNVGKTVDINQKRSLMIEAQTVKLIDKV